MAQNQISFDNKVTSNPQPSVPEINKVTDANINEIKSVVNNNATDAQAQLNTKGAFSGLGKWAFSSSTGNPSAGQITLDNSNPTSATTLKISFTDADSLDKTLLLAFLTNTGYKLVFSGFTNSNKFYACEITGATGGAGFYQFTVTHIGNSGLADGDLLGCSIQSSAGSGAEWGDITGTLANQTDLQTALDAKENGLGNPVTDNYILASTSAGVRSWIPNAAGGNIIEDGTRLRFGTGSDVGTSGNRRGAFGGNTLADTDDSLAIGYNAKTGSKGFAIGINNGFVSAGAGAMGIGNDIREIEAQSLVITPLSNQSTVGLRTKSIGSIMIGTNLNINSQTPANGTVNKGVFIGSAITSPVANLGARAVMIGANLNCGASYEMTLIGKQTTVDASANYQRTVAIGDELVLNENGSANGVVIGYKAGGGISAGTGATGGQFVSIGTEAFAGSWRCTVIGAFSRADYVSSTILGYGCYSGVAHGNIFGRGGYLLDSPITGGSSTLLHSSHTNDVVIVGNAYAKFTNPYVEGSDEVVDNVTAQNNGTITHRITTASGLDVDDTPTASNVKGANLEISAGVGTGTATSGELRFSSAPAGASGNTENALEIAAKIDAESGVDTRFLLLDVTSGTLKRVEFGADDSAGAGFKVLKVAN